MATETPTPTPTETATATATAAPTFTPTQTPTAVPLAPAPITNTVSAETSFPTPQYHITLPSGGQLDVHMSATAGDLFITMALITLTFVILFVAIRHIAHEVTS